MNDTSKLLIVCAIFVYLLGIFTKVVIDKNTDKGACQVTYSHKDKVVVMVGKWN